MEEFQSISPEIIEEAQEATLRLLPDKSKEHYEKEFVEFNNWREKRHVRTITEEVMLSYFLNMKKKYAVSSMWSKYSMLKATLKIHKNIDLSKYGKLTVFLKSISRGYKVTKANVLERKHIEEFLISAPDEQFLMIKVALIMGVAGACRYCELTNLKIEDVKDTGSYLLVSIPDTKTNISRKFTIIEEGFSVNAVSICKKYILLRPKGLPHRRFFLRYVNEKCTAQVVGINTLTKVPFKVASFLKLPNAETYTGYCMRRTLTTLLADKGANILTIKRHGGWRSSGIAESYIEDSVSNKLNIAKKIQEESSSSRQGDTFIVPANSSTVPDVTISKNVEKKMRTNDNEIKITNGNLCVSLNKNVNVNK